MKYSEKEKIRVVKMYYKLGSVQRAIRKLGYPKARNMVYNWIKVYEETGRIKDKRNGRKHKLYSEEEKRTAIKFYYAYGKGYKETVEKLGYPSTGQLTIWIKEDKDGKITCKNAENVVKYSQENIIKAAAEYCNGNASIVEISTKYSVPIDQIRECLSVLLNKEYENTMQKADHETIDLAASDYESIKKIIQEKEQLKEERKVLQREIEQLRMERDALEMAGKLLKKYTGTSLEGMNNRNKATVIGALNNRYLLNKLLKATPHKDRLTPLCTSCLHIFRHLAQLLLDIRQYACVEFVQSDGKSDVATRTQSLCGIALNYLIWQKAAIFINLVQ